MDVDRRALLGQDYWLVLATPEPTTTAADIERHVDGHDDGHVVSGSAEARDDTGERRPDGRAVVEHRERERERVGALADGDRLVAGLGQQPPDPLGERLVAEARERLRRAEPAARSADEEDPRQASIRHASL